MDMMQQGMPQQMPQQGNAPDGGMAMTPPGQPSMPGGPMMPSQMGQGQPQPQGPSGMVDSDADSDPMQEQVENYMDYALSQANLAKKYRGKKDDDGMDILDNMGTTIGAGIESDIASRQDWMDKNEEWLKLALLIREGKSFPWPKASNVKYPLIATAAMQFSARAYPALVPSDGKVVKARVSATDPQGLFEQKALRVAIHMSYQITCQIPNWEEEMDKLLMTMAVSGICFKKTWHDALMNIHRSEIVYPENLIINYYAKSLETAYRKTEVLFYTSNELYTKMNNREEFLDPDSDETESDDDDSEGDDYGTTSVDEATPIKLPIATDVIPPEVDASTPHKFYACHTYWDLDDDGYEEPYIVTIHAATQKVVKIVARWDSDGVKKNEDGKIIFIQPVEYFTDFPFIPNADGSIYAVGFGMLMGPLNEAVNTLVNQLIDAGTLSTLSGGFIGKNLRIKMGQLKIQPGEWKVVNAGGEEMQKSFYPIPTKEPSPILFSLLQFLVTSGNQLASIAEIFVGKMPGQNTPATTTQETVQQGMAVFTAIYKRVYRSLAKEFQKLYRLNRVTPGIMQEEMLYTGAQLQESDYSGTEHFIIPGADPTGDSATVRQQKLQTVGQLLSLGTINPQVYTQRMLDSMEIPNAQELIAQPQPPAPDPKMQTEQAKQQTIQMKAQTDQQAKEQGMQIKQQEADLRMQERQETLEYQKQMDALKLQAQAHGQHLDQISATVEANHQANMQMMQRAMDTLKNIDDRMHAKALNKMELENASKMAQIKQTNTKAQGANKQK
jgi:chaperonin GroES